MKKVLRAIWNISSVVFLVAGGVSMFVSDDWYATVILFMASAILGHEVAIEDLEEKTEKL